MGAFYPAISGAQSEQFLANNRAVSTSITCRYDFPAFTM
jgi:hypothetical protein